MNLIGKIQRKLENEISSRKFINLYRHLREKDCILSKFATPIDLKNFLHQRKEPDYATNDRMILKLIEEYQYLPEPSSIGSYLLIIFTPGLNKIYDFYAGKLKTCGLDLLDLWLEIRTVFLEVIADYEIRKKESRQNISWQRKVAARILGMGRNRIRALFKERGAEKNAGNYTAGAVENSGNALAIAEGKALSALDNEENYLDELVRAGVINETDRYILTANLVYGHTLKEISQKLKDMSHVAIR